MQKKEVKILPWQKLYKVGFFNIRQCFIEHKYFFIRYKDNDGREQSLPFYYTHLLIIFDMSLFIHMDLCCISAGQIA